MRGEGFNEWFQTFLEEKELSDVVFEFENNAGWNYIPIEVIQEYLSFCNEEVQNKIKIDLVKTDFCNMNILKYLEYIAKGIGNS
ncbi:hypothetical protein ES705_07080 [subsurface metagenome]